MNFIDLHCDTAGRIFYEDLELKKSICNVDIEKLKKGECLGQVFAMFVDQEVNSNCYEEFLKIYDKFKCEIIKNNCDIEIVTNIKELERARANCKIGAFISIEEGEVINGDINKLQEVYDMGVRILTITWNYVNKLGYPNYLLTHQNKGLTKTGIDIVSKCEELGIIPDCSHLSDGGFYDLVKVCKKPFIASHSNSRYITNHPRNLTDDMIKLLANKGGVMGLNFCSDFLGEEKIASLNEIVTHAKHIKNVGGIDVLCLGSDFDGILNEVEFKDSSRFSELCCELKKNKFSEDEIEKIFYKNILRVFKETLK